MRTLLGSPTSFPAAVLLDGCVLSPPPQPPTPPSVANDMAKALLRQGLNEADMMKLRGAQRKRDDMDLVCLSAEQRAEFKQREQHAATDIVRVSIERMTLAMQRRSPQVHKERVAAQYALDRCEEALPANVDKGSACIEERAERARWGPEPSPSQEAPGHMTDSMTRMARARAAIRAEYPACGEMKWGRLAAR